MEWWGWLLIGWLVVALFSAFWLARAAAIARRRERETRRHQYEQEKDKPQ